jgi:anti-sigma-K factor RskA
MTESEDIDGLAAEYVLGSLDADERKDVAARRNSDAVLDHAIKAWEMRLGPLGDQIPGIEPPPYVLRRLTDRLWPRQGPAIKPKRTRRALIVGACALAACLALLVVWPRDVHGSPATLIAQLQRSPAGTVLDDGANIWTPFRFEVSFDFRASTVVVSPVAAAASLTRHYQLWLMPRDSGPPISLGMIALPQTTTSPWLATYPPDKLLTTTLVVSLEPEGGSPIGMPSGPLVFVGKLYKAPTP